jgi:phage FluMu protein Com
MMNIDSEYIIFTHPLLYCSTETSIAYKTELSKFYISDKCFNCSTINETLSKGATKAGVLSITLFKKVLFLR